MKFRNFILLSIGFLSIATAALAQAPNWSVNPNRFQYSMTITAVVELNCNELVSPSNQLGAFVGDSLRGSAFTSTVIGGRYEASMTIYSDLVNGENITFRFYQQSSDSIYFGVDSIQFQDNAIFGSPANPFVVKNNNKPSVITISNDTLQENLASGATVGSFTATDKDAGQTFTYSLVSGTGSNNNLFTISGSTLTANFSADFENKSSYAIRVRATDNFGCSKDSTYTIYIKNANDSPTAITLSSTQINENNTVNAVVATLNAIDSDANEQFTFSLLAGAGGSDNAAFNIVGNNLRATNSFNFENKSVYSIRLQVSDKAANTHTDTFKILVNNLNEAPTDILLSTDTIQENKSVNTLLATLSTVDEDAGQSFTYSFDNVAGNDNANFNLIGNSLRTAANFDYETRSLYFLYIKTDDLNGGTLTKQISIRVTNANDNPSDIQLTSNTVAENQPISSFVGRIISVDQDTGSTFSYSLATGTGDRDNANFQISNDSLLTNTVFNVNMQPSQNIRLQVTDNNGGTFQKAFTITISDINNAPSALFLSNNNVAESTTLGSVVGNFTTTDSDANDVHTYTLVSGAGDSDNDDFLITGADLKTDTVFNVNSKSQYSIRVRTTDQFGLFFEKQITINIFNSNDAPTNITLAPTVINENLPTNSLVGSFTTTDPDVADVHTYSFASLSANDNASFVIIGNELRTSSTFDFETKSIYFVQIQTTDASGGAYSKQILVNVLDTNDRPTDLNLSAFDVNEKQTTNQFVGKISTTDQDATDSFTYSLVAGNGNTDNGSFIISNDSLFATANFDYLVKNVLSIRLRTTDAALTFFEKVFSINVQNVNDAPTDITLDNSTVPENISINATVGNFSSSDIDPMPTFTYSLVAGMGDADNSNFTISGNQLRSAVLMDYNNKRTHNIRVRTTDQGGLFVEKTFTVNISNSNDNPTNISLAPNTFNENLPQSSFIGLFSSVDKDSSDSFSYSFVNQGSNDNASFIISGNELRTGVNFNFENKNLFVIQVQTRDDAGATYDRQLTVNVNDSNDAPTAIAISSDSITEKLVKGSFVANLSTTDEDAIDNFSYTLVAGQGSADNALFRINGSILETDSSLNFNNSQIRRVRIQSTDKGGKTIQKAFTIRVINQNDLPTAIILSQTTVNEVAPIGTRVAIISTTDEDATDTFTYNLVAGNGDTGNSNFTIVGNELRTNSNFDFETQDSYSIRIRTTDSQGGNLESVFTITLTNGNEKPNISAQFYSINENSAPNTTIGTVVAEDMDIMETFTYKILGTQIDFRIEATTGILTSSRTFDYENNTNYDISIEVSDAGGLKDTAIISVEILDQIEGTLPTASYFSPNGDGRNDEWRIQNVELYSDYSLKIFSVNGEVVYEKANSYNNDWRGTLGGTQLPDGIYYYYFENTINPSQNFKGVITLKR